MPPIATDQDSSNYPVLAGATFNNRAQVYCLNESYDATAFNLGKGRIVGPVPHLEKVHAALKLWKGSLGLLTSEQYGLLDQFSEAVLPLKSCEWSRGLLSGKYVAWLAKDVDAAPAAILIVEPGFDIYSNFPSCRIHRLETRPFYRAQGLATGLLACAARFAELAMPEPCLHSTCNPQSNEFYSQRIGMTPHSINGYYLNDEKLKRVAELVNIVNG